MHLSFEVVGQLERTLQKLCQYGNRLVRQHAQDNLASRSLAV
ncbi:hypothetical protein [Synechococcus elongatus]